jgi:hypothetical protein
MQVYIYKPTDMNVFAAILGKGLQAEPTELSRRMRPSDKADPRQQRKEGCAAKTMSW